MQEELLRMEQVFYRYPGEKTDALRNCSLTIRQKEKLPCWAETGLENPRCSFWPTV